MLQITSGFILAKKKLGVRCTLTVRNIPIYKNILDVMKLLFPRKMAAIFQKPWGPFLESPGNFPGP